MAVMFAMGLLAGFILRRWLAVLSIGILLILGCAVLFYAGLHRGWWGHGLGDNWFYAAKVTTALSLVAYVAGEALAYALQVPRGSTSPGRDP